MALTAERALVARARRDLPHARSARTRGCDGDALALAAYVGLPDGSRWIRDALDGDRRATRPRSGAAVASGCWPPARRELLAEAERARSRG